MAALVLDLINLRFDGADLLGQGGDTPLEHGRASRGRGFDPGGQVGLEVPNRPDRVVRLGGLVADLDQEPELLIKVGLTRAGARINQQLERLGVGFVARGELGGVAARWSLGAENTGGPHDQPLEGSRLGIPHIPGKAIGAYPVGRPVRASETKPAPPAPGGVTGPGLRACRHHA